MAEKWQPFILGAEDDWSEVRDSGQRKRIQNRLAQRARRANLKARRDKVGSISDKAAQVETQAETPEAHDGVVADNDTEGLFEIPGLGNEESESPDVVLDPPSSTVDTQLDTLQPGLDTQFLLLSSLTTVAALSSNATLLHIPCEVPSISIFNPSHTSLPPTLMPTELQKTIPHPPFVDVIPFPGVRDRLLRSLAVIDLEKLTIDLTGGAFKVWGSVPWDGASWEVSGEFAKKWWFLIDGELLRATNFWRRQRLEPSISASDILFGV
ncbi:hypothetical protein LCI18_012160 [Fusarium solani-melongenae]|uniref:Uncharacterized protein n=1 Tax=Fusarium solani subsp. cucurbitae TaxID=2747967 RepID=A0ACD3ZJ10_FUSSC|nr:hypothetical protein LCI18_012160 [Fusarium solani-melongenae]